MRNGILNSNNKKDKLYKTLIQTDTNNTVLYEIKKLNLKNIVQAFKKTYKESETWFLYSYI